MVGGLHDVITCAEFQIGIFMGYDFTGGRIFDFPIDFSMGLTTVQRYCAACDKLEKLIEPRRSRIRPKGVENCASTRPPNLSSTSCDFFEDGSAENTIFTVLVFLALCDLDL